MPLAERNDVVEQIHAAATDDSVLPRTSELVCLGRMPRLGMMPTTSPPKFAARSKIRYLGEES